MTRPSLPALLFALTCALAAHGQAPAIDPEIASAIAAIPAIDNHAHPVLPPPGDLTDRGFDALPVDNMEPQTDPVAWRTDNPQLLAAWKALWSVDATFPLDTATRERLSDARAHVKAREGEHYAAWVLDQAGIETMLANRVALGPGLAAPRFRWVPYADALLLPFDTTALAQATPDRTLFFPLEDRVRTLYLHQSGLVAVPPTLAAYLDQVVLPTLRRQHTAGAVAEKFELAYLRPLDITAPSRAEADNLYTTLLHRPHPDPAAYKLLQDFLFRAIAAECGRLGMPVHLHVMSGGGGYFEIAGANPLLLEPLFNDPTLRSTRFVLLHGGWPFVREAGALLQKPNVFLDLSQQALTFPPRTLAGWLREWLETFPDKILFGTDGYPLSPEMGYEEATWIAARNAREALGIALTGMLDDHEITLPRALAIAHAVLHDNAAVLYTPTPSSTTTPQCSTRPRRPPRQRRSALHARAAYETLEESQGVACPQPLPPPTIPPPHPATSARPSSPTASSS